MFENVSDTANLTLQALAHLGKNNIDSSVLTLCANTLTDRDVRGLIAHVEIAHQAGWLKSFSRLRRQRMDEFAKESDNERIEKALGQKDGWQIFIDPNAPDK